MPSFDVVSEVDKHELSNAVAQANKEIGTRFDFKGSDSKIELGTNDLVLISESDFKIQQIKDILVAKLVKRGVDVGSLKPDAVETRGVKAQQRIAIQEGLDKEIAKKIVKLIKQSKMKVQAAIQGEQVRITGKKRDDLQATMKVLKDADLEIPLQFNNFRD